MVAEDGFTPIWDYICGTVRPKYESDFDAIMDRRSKKIQPAAVAPEVVAAE